MGALRSLTGKRILSNFSTENMFLSARYDLDDASCYYFAAM
jgi:hypothetical protein